MLRGTESFRDVWTATIFPSIKSEYEALVREVPARLKAKRELNVDQDPKKVEWKTRMSEEIAFAYDTPDFAIHRKMEGILEDLRATSAEMFT